MRTFSQSKYRLIAAVFAKKWRIYCCKPQMPSERTATEPLYIFWDFSLGKKRRVDCIYWVADIKQAIGRVCTERKNGIILT